MGQGNQPGEYTVMTDKIWHWVQMEREKMGSILA